MRRKRSAHEIRRATLKALVPVMHAAAANWLKKDPEGNPPTPSAIEIAAAIRQLADRFDDLGTRGTVTVVAEMWGLGWLN